jgi:tetratricopeptide (TPR) repeat protein
VGFVFAVNTMGTLLGAVFAGYVGLPRMGIKGTLELAVAANIGIGLIALCIARDQRGGGRRLAVWSLAVALVVCAAYYTLMPAWDVRMLDAGQYRLRERITDVRAFEKVIEARKLQYYRDGVDATVSVRAFGADLSGKLMAINGKPDASTGLDMLTQKTLGHLPLFLHARPRKVLVVGIGSGSTVGAVLAHPEVESVDVIEISREVIEASKLFARVNGRYWEDARVRISHEDAKTFMQLCGERYDVIISEPSNPWVAGVAGLFSVEYFRLCRERLAPGGIVCQWTHAYEMDSATYFMILETITTELPFYSMWSPQRSDLIVMASPAARTPDLGRMRGAMAEKTVRDDLALLGIRSPLPFLAMQMCDRADRPSHVAWTGVVHSDLFPVLEYSAPVGFFIGADASRVHVFHDWRTRSAANADLMIRDYLRECPLHDDDFAEYVELLRRNDPLPSLLCCWVREWTRAFPGSARAWAAYAEVVPGSNRETIEALAGASRAGAITNLATARAELALGMVDYRGRRSCIGSGGWEALLRAHAELRERFPGENDYLLQCTLGELLHDAGRQDEAVAALREALVLADGAGRTAADTVEAAMLLCRVLLGGGKTDEALAVFERRLAALRNRRDDVYFLDAAIRAGLRRL